MGAAPALATPDALAAQRVGAGRAVDHEGHGRRALVGGQGRQDRRQVVRANQDEHEVIGVIRRQGVHQLDADGGALAGASTLQDDVVRAAVRETLAAGEERDGVAGLQEVAYRLPNTPVPYTRMFMGRGTSPPLERLRLRMLIVLSNIRYRPGRATRAPTEHARSSLHCSVVVQPNGLSLRVDAPGTLGVDKPAFLPARVQARELGRERTERMCYVYRIPCADGDEDTLGLELERGQRRALPDPKGGGEGGGEGGRGRRAGPSLLVAPLGLGTQHVA